MSNLPTLPPSNEVPPARRESAEVSLSEIDSAGTRQKSFRGGLPFRLAILGCIGIGSIGFWQRDRLSPFTTTLVSNTHKTALHWQSTLNKALTKSRGDSRTNPSKTDRAGTDNLADELADSSSADRQAGRQAGRSDDARAATVVDESTAEPEQLLNHRRYDVADVRQLVPLAPNNQILLQPDAQASLATMLVDAEADGVQLGIISGFRTLEDQRYLYFDVKAERGESARTRAEVSAPPGYSEHHTGYAVDFVDKTQPETHLEESFELTPAYQWLIANAPYYNFELSFPEDNAAVAFEPWHWRYVGNQESLELFYK